MLGRLKIIAALVLVSALVFTASYHFGKHKQREQSALVAAQAVSIAVQKRAGINEAINNTDAVALCHELGGVRDECKQLRRLAKD